MGDDKLSVPKIIRSHLGASKFTAATGAKNYQYNPTSLQFDLPRTPGFVKNNINRVVIKLNDTNLYNVEFFRISRRKWNMVSCHTNINANALLDVIEQETGLSTSTIVKGS